MNTGEYLTLSRNHNGCCREMFSFIDASLNAAVEEYATLTVASLQSILGEVYDNIISHANAMKDALDELE